MIGRTRWYVQETVRIRSTDETIRSETAYSFIRSAFVDRENRSSAKKREPLRNSCNMSREKPGVPTLAWTELDERLDSSRTYAVA